MSNVTLDFGPRLIANPTGALRSAVMLRPGGAIERALPLPSEPGVIHARAFAQHEILEKTLRSFGVEVHLEHATGEDPYECSVIDAAVLFENGAVITRPSAMRRRAEADRMEALFTRIDVPIAGHISAPGLFDGGDALLLGDAAFIGVGARGNTLGRSGFSDIAGAHGYRVIEVKLAASVRSLRSVVSAVSHDTVVIAADLVDPEAFADFHTVILAQGEQLGAGVLCLGNAHVLTDVRYRTTSKLLRKARISVVSIDLYEFAKVGITPSQLVLPLRRA